MIERYKDAHRDCSKWWEAFIPPVRTPKSQPVVEQPLTGEFLSPPKKTKTKERLQWRW